MGIKEYKKRPINSLEKKVLQYIAGNPGTWSLYKHFKQTRDRDVDQALTTLQQYGYLKQVGTVEGRTTWYLSDAGHRAYCSMMVNLTAISWDKQEDGSYKVTHPYDKTSPGTVLKLDGGSWAFLLPKDAAKNKPFSSGPFRTRNDATEALIDAYYSAE